MIKRLGFILLATALIVADCGRQVTPNKPGTTGGGTQPGYMTVKFNVAAGFNFNAYTYVVVFNTSGDGKTPTAWGAQNNYPGYSYMVAVTNSGGQLTWSSCVYQRQLSSSSLPVLLAVPANAQEFPPVQVTSSGSMTFTFARILAAFYATPSPAPTATATATATATPTATPTGSPTATPSPTPSPGSLAPIWYYNYFTVQGNIVNCSAVPGYGPTTILDSLGSNGNNDSSFTDPTGIDTTTFTDTGTFYASIPTVPLSDQQAQISGGEIINSP